MKPTFRFLHPLFFSAIFLLLFLSLPLSAAAKIPLKVGVLNDFPPQYQLTEQGQPGGLAVDIFEALIAETEYTVDYQIYTSWSELQQALKKGNIDIIPDMGIADFRREWASFSLPIETCQISLFVRKGNNQLVSLDQFKNNLLGVVRLNVGEKLAQQHGGLQIKDYHDVVEAFHGLISGHVDGVIFPKPTFMKVARDGRLEERIQIAGDPVKEVKCGLAVKRGNEDLLESFNPIIQRFTNSEDYAKIYSRWYGQPIPYWNSQRIVIAFSIAFAVLAVIMSAWRYLSLRTLNQKLQREVAEQTRDLEEREYKFRMLLNNQHDAIFLRELKSDGFACFEEVNNVAIERYGFSKSEFEKLSPEDITPTEEVDRSNSSGARQQLLSEGKVIFEAIHQTKSGKRFPVEINVSIIELKNKKYILSTARDITLRKEAEKLKADSLDQLENITENVPGMVYQFAVSKEGHFSMPFASEVIEEMFQVTADAVKDDATPIFKNVHPDDIDSLIESIHLSQSKMIPWQREFRVVHPDDSIHWIFGSSTPQESNAQTLWHGFLTEITTQKEAEQHRLDLEIQLGQKHKMEAVGYMAGGMAHNFNNNLSIILGNIELAQMKQSPGSDTISMLKNAKIAVLRSRDLILKIITYSRRGIQEKVPLQLPDIIDETITLMRSTLPSTIELQQTTSPDCRNDFIFADPSQIQEIIINLCNNAVHAMEERGPLNISLGPVDLAKEEIPAQYEQPPGRYAHLSIQDCGCGMDAILVEKIFDPFFSTKEEHEGAGMGLATVQGIVAQHDGIIKVDSSLGQGTTFHLYFPLIKHDIEKEKAEVEEDMPRGTELVLFVDDDPSLAELGQKLLSEMGYRVSMMTDSREALKLFTANSDKIDLLISDQTMPGLTGEELIAEAKKIRPNVPAILCTGYSSRISEKEAIESGIDAFLMKPLDMPQLLQTIRKVLDKSDAVDLKLSS